MNSCYDMWCHLRKLLKNYLLEHFLYYSYTLSSKECLGPDRLEVIIFDVINKKSVLFLLVYNLWFSQISNFDNVAQLRIVDDNKKNYRRKSVISTCKCWLQA